MNKVYIKRPHYLKKIIPYIGKDVIKVLIGQRRVGKSYLLLQIMDELKKQGVDGKNIIYINKELHEFEDILDHRDLLKYIKSKSENKAKKYVF